MPVRLVRGSIGVVQKVLVILQSPSFWVTVSWSRRPFWHTPVYHTWALYIKTGMIRVL